MRVLQVRFHDDIDGSSLARAIYASTGPLLLPFDSGFLTHTQRCGLFVIFWEFEPESYRGRGEKRRLQFETPFAILFSPVL